jgi:alpha-L-fucosidase 2
MVLIRPYVESQREKEWKNIKVVLAGIKLTYDKLLKEHSTAHARLFNSAELDLANDDRDDYAEDLLENTAEEGLTPALAEKLWAFGRYLMICATGEKARPMTPYGLWCGDYKAVNADARADGAIFAMYQHALAGGLPQYLLSPFNTWESILDDLKKNAARLFGVRGIVLPAVTAPGSGLVGSTEPSVLHFTAGAGMAARLFYDYYLFTGDVKFLKGRALPFMKEVALFYEEFFKLKDDGFYETSPSYSPDNTPAGFVSDIGEPLNVCKSATVDFAVAKDVLTNLIAGAEIAGVYKAETEKWRDMLAHIPSYKLNMDGTVQEYLDTRYNDNPKCATAAQLFPAFPGTEMTDTDADILKAFGTTAKKRLASGAQLHTVGTLANLACVLLRAGDAEGAFDALTGIVRADLMDNMVTADNDWRGMGTGVTEPWAAYNAGGNLAITNAVQEMLVQSSPTLIKLLPAVPEAFRKGSVSGLLTRAGVEADVEWDLKKGHLSAKLKAKSTVKIDLLLPVGTKKYKGPNFEGFNAETRRIKDIELAAGKSVGIDAWF